MKNDFLKPLFIKPLYDPKKILYSKHWVKINKLISFRSCNLDSDIDMIHQWVNLDYAIRYWQLDGSRSRVYETYHDIQRSSHAHSFIILLGLEPICQIDIYRVLSDEIRQYVNADLNDCGFHLLMSPNKSSIKFLTSCIILALLDFYYSFPEASRMFAEPDITNEKSNSLLIETGFSKIQSIQMSYKTANLYCGTRKNFEEHFHLFNNQNP